ncbi:hypothetical protein NRB56_64850 [Nocardia sp. RB56]|uniref:HTH tetR-type domain-containing protein n=1 Tax=Nocardia aurantia TaxID=2585199 RepID=A0A7K0DYW2_9NOCA|nr:hypothetical protein [Nocardia aurantia]
MSQTRGSCGGFILGPVSNEDVTAAARAVVRRVGITALTLAAVAKEAGISRATMYRRFASRDTLIAAVIGAELDALEKLVLARLRFADQPRETTHMLVREVLDYLTNHAALQAAIHIDGSALLPWLIKRDGRPTLVDIVTDRALAHIEGSELAAHLRPNPGAAVEFMVGAVYTQLVSPSRYLTHANIATLVTDAVVAP